MEPLRPVSKPVPPAGLRPEHVLSADPVWPLPSGRAPQRIPIEGDGVRLEPLDPARHAAELFAASHADAQALRVWDWLPYGPFADLPAFGRWLAEGAEADDPLLFAIRPAASGRAEGMAAFMAIRPQHGVLEIGHIWFAPPLQRTRAASAVLMRMIAHAFDGLGCRRVEWKCDALNERSRRAALRLGFRFEGIFYRHMVVKGRNRDTAWFSIIEAEWPERRAAFACWLAADNFDALGRQIRALAPAADGGPAAR